MSRHIDKWLLQQEGITARQWKVRKRWELKRAIAAWEKYQLGCASAPGYDISLVQRISESLAEMKRLLSVKNWGR